MPDAPANPTTPAAPIVAAFFQPERNLAMLAAMGVNVFLGPEVENARGMAPDALAAKKDSWCRKVESLGCKYVLKPGGSAPAYAYRLDAIAGLLLTVDEPNAKGVLPAAVRAESDALRAAYPGVPIWLSLAGDKVTSANLRKPAELQLLTDYLACADVVTTNNYAKNRNATRYPTTWTGDAVKTVKAVRPDVRVVPWVEMNDQRLPAPTSQTVPGTPDVNREPTPDEIRATVDYALAMGADGIGWFATCDSGKYGWGFAGDSYWPVVNRNGVSLQPQLDMVATISRALSGTAQPAPAPTDADVIARLRRDLADAERRAADAANNYAIAAARVAELQTAARAYVDAKAAAAGALADLAKAAK